MDYLSIEISQDNVTVDLSYFKDISKSNINWGDGFVTNDTLVHTYQNGGRYNILAIFKPVEEIQDNFTIPHLKYISFPDIMDNLEKIGNNFLIDCDELKMLDLSKLIVESIGENFLENCSSINCLKLPYAEGVTLGSWGENALNENTKIVCGVYTNYYENATNWEDKSELMMNVGFEYRNITESNVYDQKGKIPYLQVNYLDITKYPNIQTALNNNHLIPIENVEPYKNPETLQIYYSSEQIKKSHFILDFSYNFVLNQDISEPIKYKTPILLQALRLVGNKLYYKSYRNDTYLYLNRDEESIDVKEIDYDYMAPTLINTDSEYTIDKFYRINLTKLQEWQDLDDPNYAMGKLVFGIIDDTNVRHIEYDGDEETGFILKISAKGVCKNFTLYSNFVDSKLKRRPYIKINTDYLEGGMILAGDYIEICTIPGSKYAFLVRNNVRYNILKYIDINSTYLKIVIGDNQFYCTADSDIGNILNLNVFITYRDLFVGV